MPLRNHRNKYFSLTLLASAILVSTSQSQAAVGPLLWEEDFNTLNTDIWNVDIGDGCDQGLCGWGNQELQWYSQGNVYVQPIAGEPGNSGLVLEARNENQGSKAFTSGKIQSKDKLAIKYGLVEFRMKVSNIDTGLWPALWLLGTSTASWPAKGEIDVMEMGQSAAQRADAGYPGAPLNNYTGSNLIFYADAACSDGNPSCAASTAWQTDNAHLSSTPLTDRFVTYRLYWTEQQIRFTVVDNGVEYDMYDQPFTISDESDEFRQPFYLLMDLAVGGTFTDALNNSQVTAPLPAKMVVDYVRVYELDGQGEVIVGNTATPESGTFGVFTDNTPTNNRLQPGVDSDLYIWNQNAVEEGNLAPFEGDNVVAWNYFAANQWFGGGFQSHQPRDMSAFRENGTVTFRINIPADVAFKIGIADTYTNENWITFPANTTKYGLTRNGSWAQATIPVTDLAGDLVALQSLGSVFNIASVDGALPDHTFQMALDDIVWTGGGEPVTTDSDGDGVEDSVDQCPDTPGSASNNGCPDNNSSIDYTDLPGQYSAQYTDSPANEDISRVFDNDPLTKYLTFHAAGYVQYHVNDNAYPANEYRITSANDAPERDPLSWTLQGSNDGSNWVTLDSRSNEDFANRFEARTFTFSNSTAYQTYRLNMSNNSGGILQLAEVDILGPDTPASPSDTDNDGIPDNLDNCPGTQSGATVDGNGCPVGDDDFGVEQSSSTSLTFYVNTANWADVHYIVNSGPQQNLRMDIEAGRNVRVLDNLSPGDTVEYWFTYQQNNGQVVDTAHQNVTFSGNGNSGGNQTPVVQVEAENYTRAFDTDAGNNGGAYRNDDVDIEVTSDGSGGHNVGWMVASEWLEYDVDIDTGTYDLTSRVASNTANGALDIIVDGNVVANDNVNNTGGWQTFETHSLGQVTISQSGTHTIRVNVTGSDVNLNWLKLTLSGN